MLFPVMRLIQFSSVVIGFLVSGFIHASQSTYVELESFFYSDPVPIKSLSNGWKSDYKSGDAIFTFDRVETGIAWDNWKMGLFYRYDYVLKFRPDTAEIVYKTKNKLPLQPGEEFAVLLEMNGVRTRGARLAHQIPIRDDLVIQTSFSLMEGIEYLDGRMEGNVTAIAEKDYDFLFDIYYAYSQDVFFDRDTTTPRSKGYSLDLSLSWQPNNDWLLLLEANDFWNQIIWFDSPFTSATGASSNKIFDSDGYVRYNPVISGLEGNSKHKQKLNRKIFVSSDFKLNNEIHMLSEYRDFEVKQFFSIGGAWHLKDSDSIQGLYDVVSDSFRIGFSSQQLSVSLETDSLRLNSARVFSFNAAYQYQF